MQQLAGNERGNKGGVENWLSIRGYNNDDCLQALEALAVSSTTSNLAFCRNVNGASKSLRLFISRRKFIVSADNEGGGLTFSIRSRRDARMKIWPMQLLSPRKKEKKKKNISGKRSLLQNLLIFGFFFSLSGLYGTTLANRFIHFQRSSTYMQSKKKREGNR